MFYQYGPFDPTGGVKHWGHVRSRDLFHWERLPVMLYPDEPFDCHGVYSGSALVEDGMLYLYYTGNVKHPGEYDYIKQGRGHNVCLATSRDAIHLDNKRCLMYNQDYPAGLTCHVPEHWTTMAKCWCLKAPTSCTGTTSTPSLPPKPLATCGNAPTCLSWTASGFWRYRPRALLARTCTAAVTLPCRVTGAPIAH